MRDIKSQGARKFEKYGSYKSAERSCLDHKVHIKKIFDTKNSDILVFPTKILYSNVVGLSTLNEFVYCNWEL